MRLGLVALLLVATAACGGNEEIASPPAMSEAEKVRAWQDELKKVGFVPPSWERWETFTRDTLCEEGRNYDYYVTLDSGGPSLSQQRIGLKYACPENLAAWDAAVIALGETRDRVEYICNTPLSEMSREDQEAAVAVCDGYTGDELN